MHKKNTICFFSENMVKYVGNCIKGDLAMEIKFLNQPKDMKLGDLLCKRLQEGFEEIHIVAGMAKDSGFEDIMEALAVACQKSKNVNLYIGIDRKNTSKDILSKLISLGAKVHIHINTDESKVETRLYVFENKKKESYIYTTGGKFSSGGLLESNTTFLEIKYHMSNAEDKNAFSSAKSSILQGIIGIFQIADLEEIILLAEKGEISARITERKIPNINEMYGSTGTSMIGEQMYDENSSNSSIKLEELADIDIDLDPEISVRKNVKLEIEKEIKREQEEKEEFLKNLKKSASDLDKFYDNKLNETETLKKPKIRMSDTIDYQNMTTLMIECNKILEKGVGAGEFKIPKALAENLTEFFDGIVKTSELSFEILDNTNMDELIPDNLVEFQSTEKGITIKSKLLNAMKPLEGDIIRLIKEDPHKFRCEIIRKNSAEYDIWNCYLTNILKGSKRKFGII